MRRKGDHHRNRSSVEVSGYLRYLGAVTLLLYNVVLTVRLAVSRQVLVGGSSTAGLRAFGQHQPGELRTWDVGCFFFFFYFILLQHLFNEDLIVHDDYKPELLI